jgi:hypothetical protein
MTPDGTPYRPSNGTEGMWFEDKFCSNCIHDCPKENGKKCEIILYAMMCDVTDKEYPREWIYKDNKPTCTNFVKWDWGSDGDPDDPDNPNAPLPPTPINQLDLFPTYPDEVYYEKNCPLFSTASRE